MTQNIETKADITYWKYDGDIVRVCIFYKASDGSTKWHDGTFRNQPNGQALLEHILRYMTGYVKRNWQRIEVTTPTTNHYGTLQGGYAVMVATKKADVLNETIG